MEICESKKTQTERDNPNGNQNNHTVTFAQFLLERMHYNMISVQTDDAQSINTHIYAEIRSERSHLAH